MSGRQKNAFVSHAVGRQPVPEHHLLRVMGKAARVDPAVAVPCCFSWHWVFMWGYFDAHLFCLLSKLTKKGNLGDGADTD